jgi:hypothetical protein
MAAAQQTTPLVTIAPAPPGAAQLAAWQRLWTLLLASGPNTSDAMADQPATGPENAHADAEATVSALKAARDDERSNERSIYHVCTLPIETLPKT